MMERGLSTEARISGESFVNVGDGNESINISYSLSKPHWIDHDNKVQYT